MTITSLSSVLLAKALSGNTLHTGVKLVASASDGEDPRSFSDLISAQTLGEHFPGKPSKTEKMPIHASHDKDKAKLDAQPMVAVSDLSTTLSSTPGAESLAASITAQKPMLPNEAQHTADSLAGQHYPQVKRTTRTPAQQHLSAIPKQASPHEDKSPSSGVPFDQPAIIAPSHSALTTAATVIANPPAVKTLKTTDTASASSPPLAAPVAHSFSSGERASTVELRTPLGSAVWQQDLAQHIIVQKPGQQTVHLKLHPEELGDVKISMTLHKDQAELMMVSAHGQVRAALEAAIPHLRQALADNGIQLGQSHVGHDMPSSQQGSQSSSQQQGQPAPGTDPNASVTESLSAPQPTASIAANPSSGIDLIA